MNKLICFIIFIFCFLFSNSSYADTSRLTNVKCHKQWCSGILRGADGSKKSLRMYTASTVYYPEPILFVLDFTTNADGFIPVLLISRANHTHLPLEKNASIFIETRIDTKPVHSSTGAVDDTIDARYIYLGRFNDSMRFIQEAQKGSNIRLKLHFIDPVYMNFSLQGFTAAFKRVMSLAEAPDSAYFN